MGDYELADMEYQDAIRYFRRVGEDWSIAQVKISQGRLAIQMQELDKAIKLINEALPTLQYENSHQLETAQRLLELAYKAKRQQSAFKEAVYES
jgi:hypothetical protein